MNGPTLPANLARRFAEVLATERDELREDVRKRVQRAIALTDSVRIELDNRPLAADLNLALAELYEALARIDREPLQGDS